MQLAVKSTKIWVANAPVDFRRSIDGLSVIVAEQLEGALPEENVFVFYNRARDKLKVLGWHRNGYVLLYKRLEGGRFTVQLGADGYVAINAQQLSWLLAGLDWVSLSSWEPEFVFDHYH